MGGKIDRPVYDVGGTVVGKAVDIELLYDQASRNTGRPKAKEALPVVINAWLKARQNFVIAGVEFGQTTYQSAGGPLSLQPLGNPDQTTTATAIASTRAPLNRRHVFAVVNGEVRHRIRNEDGSWTPWSAAGSLGYPGTATAVTTAADRNGCVHVAAVIGGQIYHQARIADGSWTGGRCSVTLGPTLPATRHGCARRHL